MEDAPEYAPVATAYSGVPHGLACVAVIPCGTVPRRRRLRIAQVVQCDCVCRRRPTSPQASAATTGGDVADNAFCMVCGAPIPRGQTSCSRCGVEKGIAPTFCAACGSRLAANAESCGICGAKRDVTSSLVANDSRGARLSADDAEAGTALGGRYGTDRLSAGAGRSMDDADPKADATPSDPRPKIAAVVAIVCFTAISALINADEIVTAVQSAKSLLSGESAAAARRAKQTPLSKRLHAAKLVGSSRDHVLKTLGAASFLLRSGDPVLLAEGLAADELRLVWDNGAQCHPVIVSFSGDFFTTVNNDGTECVGEKTSKVLATLLAEPAVQCSARGRGELCRAWEPAAPAQKVQPAKVSSARVGKRGLIPYRVIERTEFRNIKVAYDVRVDVVDGRLPTEPELAAISRHLDRNETPHERMFVTFLVAGYDARVWGVRNRPPQPKP